MTQPHAQGEQRQAETEGGDMVRPDTNPADGLHGADPTRVRFNVNGYVWVKLTQVGLDILRAEHEEMSAMMRWPEAFTPPQTDADGWSRFRLWSLAASFGANMYNGAKVPFETEIEFEMPTDGAK